MKRNKKMEQYSQITVADGLRFRMVRVPGTGDEPFIIGSPEDEEGRFDRETRHSILLSDFYMAEFLVTQELWKAVMGDSPSRFKGPQRPVEQVSWFDAAVFCNALSRMTGRAPCYHAAEKVYGRDESKQRWYKPNEGDVLCNFEANGFRLPTEAEWEYAARGGPFALQRLKLPGKDYLFAGSDLLEQVGWYGENSNGQTNDVGLLLPNALGLYDMSGNVYEWCHDWLGDNPAKLEKDYQGAEKGSRRVLRGGGWYGGPQFCRSAYRGDYIPGDRYGLIGFRLALQSVG